MRTIKKLYLSKMERKILSLALKDDDRVQNHYSKEVFHCHNLPDYISKLRTKLVKYFNNDDRFNIIFNEKRKVIKADGTIATIDIFRINPRYKAEIDKQLKSISSSEENRSN